MNKTVGKWGTIAGVASALLPDIDWPLYLLGDKLLLVKYHRWILNSIFCIPLFALILAYIFVKISHIKRFWVFFWICAFALLSHLFLDLITSYGTMIFSPLSNRRFWLDLVFIIDPSFTAILLIPLILCYFLKRWTTLICSLSLILLTLYIGLCGIYHHRAVKSAHRFIKESNIEYKKMASLPQPTSLFKWLNLIETQDMVYQGYLDFLRKPGKRSKIYSDSFWDRLFSKYNSPQEVRYRSFKKLPPSPWIQKALTLDEVTDFYEFARFPIARYRKIGGHHFVKFVDLRFSTPGMRNPFIYVVEFSPEGHLIRQGFRRWSYDQGVRVGHQILK